LGGSRPYAQTLDQAEETNTLAYSENS